MKKALLRNGMFATVLSSVLIVSACGDEEATGDENGEDFEEQEYPSTVTIGTASQGGTSYIWGGALADLLERELGVSSNVEATGGPIHNLQLLETGDADLGMTTEGPLYEGYYGEGEWVEEPHEEMRITVPMYMTPFLWWSLEDTGVTDITEHEGERVGVGPAGGTSGEYNAQIYDVLDIETGEQVQAGAGDMATQMLDQQLVHIGFAAGTPISSLSEVEAQASVNIYGIEDEETREQIHEDLPFFQDFTVTADAHEQMEEDIETVGQFNYGLAQRETNEEFIYDFVKTYHENIDHMISAHAALEEAEDPEAILENEEYPMHPGAIRYYEEVGVDIPEELYPPEYEDNGEDESEDEDE